jgi:serine/threonine protein kinase
MSAASENGGVSDTESRITTGCSSTSTDDAIARPQSRERPASLTDDALTVEMAFGADAGATERQSSAEAEPGTVLGSRYLLEQIIGRGGTSSVYRARDLRPELSPGSTTNPVAVKLARGTKRMEPLVLTRLQREFHAMRRLSHAGIARVYELDCDGGMWFMSMQLISGQTLKAWMATGHTHAEALKIIDTCCEALEYSHSMGIVHGDLKPTNVLVTHDCTAKLIDFGASSIPSSRAGLGSDPTVAATPLYASPQILAGERPEQRDDIFSLACLSYGVLSGGRHPYGGHPSFEAFRAKSAPTYLPAIPVELFEVIERGLSVERDRRPASVSEFRREVIAAEQHRRTKALLSQPVKSKPVQGISAEPLLLAPTQARGAPTIALLGKKLGSGWSVKRGKLMMASLIALMLAVAGAAVLSPQTELAPSKRTGADRLSDIGLKTPRSATIPLQASTPRSPLVPDHLPLLSAKAAPLPHDSSSISFKAAIFHASARQSLVAITVRRAPANENPGQFVWRVERGSAVPSIDYQRIGPQRVSFIEGQTVRTLFIPLLNRATSHVPPGARFFDVVLQPVPGGPSLGRFGRITVVIDPAPAIWIAKSEPTSSSLR